NGTSESRSGAYCCDPKTPGSPGLPLGCNLAIVNLMALAGSNSTKCEIRSGCIPNSLATVSGVSTRAFFTRSYCAGSLKITSNVIRSTPAFLLRIVLASSESFCVFMPATSDARSGQVGREQFERIVATQRMVDSPPAGGTCAHHLVERERH